MNKRQLEKIGIPDYALREAIQAVQKAVSLRGLRGTPLKQAFKDFLEAPEDFTEDEVFGELALALTDDTNHFVPDPISYRTWGTEIDPASHVQMQQACGLPGAYGAALMPDAHVGYGLPIGGVLAMEGKVVPYAVGVDIACRMKLSILDMPVASLDKNSEHYRNSLENGTRFGVGSKWDTPHDHDVLDRDWTVTRVTRENKDKARNQLGTSGSGNHFVEYGIVTLDVRDEELNLDAGQYVALLSHSGSRGTGASVCNVYSSIAQRKLPQSMKEFGRLAWLEMDSAEGQEYWEAMNLMGEYAAANHAVIHKNVAKLLGARIISGVENHHNFAWKETHGGKEVIVHRKGATPAGAGVLGVIPGSMASPAFIVRGKGNAESLDSASHGAGRRMSRTKAKSMYNFKAVRNDLLKKGVHIISAGSDEVPGVYKDIESVMQEQQDLVETVGRFDPKIVKMCGDGSRAED
ncbi:RtcB family protein [Rubinisphaera italica]|uniref:3'-phosphate/5'-hydroxy nucleic acid ligase n=1 Tax=Rubinisphaera italica TaxID=2527969 RepID=A0A5C5XP55_9PLAN|nr:RtcB family protein [Rubinisphaera italica]TWT64458.1 RNA-splicing ligase RtcB [Rubinisphaera italica]